MQAQPSVHRPVVAASFSLLAFGACTVAFLPPMNEHTVASIPFTVALGIAMAVSFVLHLVFIGIAAQRLGRSVLGWVVLSFFFFPVASIVCLVLFEWFGDEQRLAMGQPAP